MNIRVICPRLGPTCYLHFSTALLGTWVKKATGTLSIARDGRVHFRRAVCQ